MPSVRSLTAALTGIFRAKSSRAIAFPGSCWTSFVPQRRRGSSTRPSSDAKSAPPKQPDQGSSDLAPFGGDRAAGEKHSVGHLRNMTSRPRDRIAEAASGTPCPPPRRWRCSSSSIRYRAACHPWTSGRSSYSAAQQFDEIVLAPAPEQPRGFNARAAISTHRW